MCTIAKHRAQTGSDFFVDFGDEPRHGRFPLRQAWRLLSGGLSSLAPLVLRNAEGNRSRFAIIRQGESGEILALSERALGEGCSVVRRSHWGEVGFSEPEIRTFPDSRGRNALEPIMRVKVNALREHLEAVTTVLGARGVRVLEVQPQGRFVCLRSEARLASLLGLQDEIQSLSSGSADVACWLERYQPAATPRGTEAGCASSGAGERSVAEAWLDVSNSNVGSVLQTRGRASPTIGRCPPVIPRPHSADSS
jgi:hypothetical protein